MLNAKSWSHLCNTIRVKEQDPEDYSHVSPYDEIQNQAKLNNVLISHTNICDYSLKKMATIKFNIVISSRREAKRQTRHRS